MKTSKTNNATKNNETKKVNANRSAAAKKAAATRKANKLAKEKAEKEAEEIAAAIRLENGLAEDGRKLHKSHKATAHGVLTYDDQDEWDLKVGDEVKFLMYGDSVEYGGEITKLFNFRNGNCAYRIKTKEGLTCTKAVKNVTKA